MFIAALFTVAILWKHPKCPTSDEWIKKMWYLYTMEFYSATKNEILSFAHKWMELESITLNNIILARLRRPNAACSLSYVEYSPNTNAAIL
jgi:hypothetical protein